MCYEPRAINFHLGETPHREHKGRGRSLGRWKCGRASRREPDRMTLQIILILIGTGVVGGLMASLVGGASVITFPVLLALGLPPVVATASNLVAVSAGNFLAALTDRGKLPPFNRAFVGLVLASVLGALLGAVLLLATPERLFEFLIPLLLGFATVLFAFAGRITAWLRARASERGREWKIGVTSIPLVLPISIYGGYFGAGAGTLLLGVLMIATEGDYRRANVAKNLVSSLNTLAASVWFIANGAVSWPQTLVMMVGCLLGAYCGAHLARRVPQEAMRVVIVVVGARADRGVRVEILVLGFASPVRPAASSSRCSDRSSDRRW